MTHSFETILPIGRPAAGKREVIDYRKKTGPALEAVCPRPWPAVHGAR